MDVAGANGLTRHWFPPREQFDPGPPAEQPPRHDGTAGAFPDTLTSTWQDPVRLSRVRVHTLNSATYPAGRYGLREYDVQVSVDGSWRTVATVRGNLAGTVESTFAAVDATALRVVVQNSNDASSSRIVELEGFGAAD